MKRKLATALLVVALCMPLLGLAPKAVNAQATKIVIDYSHGQYKSSIYDVWDKWMIDNLTDAGYNVVEAWGGLNATVLDGASALLIGSTFNGLITNAEVTAISEWFAAGNVFLWVAGDSDYYGSNINDNATKVLEAVGSHIYPDGCDITDLESNAGGDYRPVANETSDDAFVEDIVAGVTKVLCHGPTTLYGSTTADPATGIVALETTSIANVYPVLYYSEAAKIKNNDLIDPVAHTEGEEGSWLCMAVEVYAGTAMTSAIAVSGASPYGDYQPMYTDEYYGNTLDGYELVEQTIDWGIEWAEAATPPTDMTMILLLGGVGVVAIVIIVAIIFMRKK
jgi:hypothetical protein